MAKLLLTTTEIPVCSKFETRYLASRAETEKNDQFEIVNEPKILFGEVETETDSTGQEVQRVFATLIQDSDSVIHLSKEAPKNGVIIGGRFHGLIVCSGHGYYVVARQVSIDLQFSGYNQGQQSMQNTITDRKTWLHHFHSNLSHVELVVGQRKEVCSSLDWPA